MRFDWEVAELFLSAYLIRCRGKAIEDNLNTRGAGTRRIVTATQDNYKVETDLKITNRMYRVRGSHLK